MTAPACNWSRRGVLAGSAAALLACADCGSTTGGTPSTAQSGAGGTAPASEPLASVSAIPSGSGLVAVGANGPVLLADAGGGKVVAHTAVCTHQGATVDAAGICPLHGSTFDITTGAVLTGPAAGPLAAVAIVVTDGRVFLA